MRDDLLGLYYNVLDIYNESKHSSPDDQNEIQRIGVQLETSDLRNLNRIDESQIPSHLAKIHTDLSRAMELSKADYKSHTRRSSQEFSIGLLYQSFTGKSITEHMHHKQDHHQHQHHQSQLEAVLKALHQPAKQTLKSLTYFIHESTEPGNVAEK